MTGVYRGYMMDKNEVNARNNVRQEVSDYRQEERENRRNKFKDSRHRDKDSRWERWN